jgi:predicted membrane protein
MRAIRNLIGLFLGLTFLTALVSAVAAAIAKERLVSKAGETDDDISLVTIYTGQDFSSKASAFRGGSILTWYGGGTVDLRGATLDPAGATLTVRTIFGGFRLVVPETWQVVTNITPIFGGVGDARDSGAFMPDAPKLTLEGFAVFGGVGIVSEAPDLEEAGDSFEQATEAPEVPAPASA